MEVSRSHETHTPENSPIHIKHTNAHTRIGSVQLLFSDERYALDYVYFDLRPHHIYKKSCNEIYVK